MHPDRSSLPCALAALLSLPAAAVANPARVDVVLLDHSTSPAITGMVLAATPSVVKAGRIVLHAVNASRKLVHEVVLVRLDGNKALPLDRAANKVMENRVKDLGEVSDLPPTKSGDLAATLTPGRYLLICNQPGHYEAGMTAQLTVTK